MMLGQSPIRHQIRSCARLRMMLRAPRSKPQMLSKPLSSVPAMVCPMEVSPHTTNLELAPDICREHAGESHIFFGFYIIVYSTCTCTCMYAHICQKFSFLFSLPHEDWTTETCFKFYSFYTMS